MLNVPAYHMRLAPKRTPDTSSGQGLNSLSHRRVLPPSSPISRRFWSFENAATKIDDAEIERDLERVEELVSRSLDTWEVQTTKFLSPLVWTAALEKSKPMADVKMVAVGGYPNAERRVIVVGREEAMYGTEETFSSAVAAMEIKGNFMFDKASHPDFLGAALGTGIERWNIGDILVNGEEGATIVCLESIVDHLSGTLVQVRSVPVTTRRIDWDQVRIPDARVKELKSVEASLRIDAVASAGFGMSRSKVADGVKDGSVKMNWQTVKKPSVIVEPGSKITLRGKGRLEIESIEQTSKGKFLVTMKRHY